MDGYIVRAVMMFTGAIFGALALILQNTEKEV